MTVTIMKSRSPRKVLLALLLLLMAPAAPLAAQSFLLSLGDSARVQVAPGTKVTVPLSVNSGAAGGTRLASLQGRITWAASQLTLDSARATGSAGWTMLADLDSVAQGRAGVVTYGTAALAASGPIGFLYFTAGANNGGTRVTFTPSAAGNESGQSVLSKLQLRSLDACVAPSGKWGDANDDGAVNVIDGQQIARASIGLSVANATVLAARGDVTADGLVNVLDAQQIARYSVALNAAVRINMLLYTLPPVASVVVLAPGTTEVAMGSALQLNAEPRDGSGASLAGCPVVTWGSDAPTVATVSASGLVTGVGPGVVTLNATSSGQSATTALTIRVVAANDPPVALGGGHSCALSSEGQAYCWGLNGSGQLGDGTNVERLSPMPVSGSVRLVALEGGAMFTCGLDASGAAWCWGSNSSGQLGDGTTENRAVPTLVLTDRRFTQITAGVTHACGIATDGDSYCWGSDYHGKLGQFSSVNTTFTRPTLVQGGGMLRFARISAGNDHTCAVQVTGEAWCWGLNNFGQLGNARTTGSSPGSSSHPLPVAVSTAQRFVTVSSGGSHTCGLTAIGKVYCWGVNSSGQLGNDDTTMRSLPVAVLGGTYAAISAGDQHSCATRSSGATACWGNNSRGQLGDGSLTDRHMPTPVNGSPAFLAVYPGGGHSCGIVTTGALRCWGNNVNGQLGDGTRAKLVSPAPIAGDIAFAQLEGGSGATCGVSIAGTAYCWGSNINGRLGIASADAARRTTPVAVAGVLTFSTVSSSNLNAGFSCGLTAASGAAYCWGANSSGYLGDGTATDRWAPSPVLGGGSYRVLAAGGTSSCALTTTNALRCWGSNFYGQLGDGTTTSKSVPTAVTTTQTFVSVAIGRFHSCAITTANALHCWGLNRSGQLGLGTTTNESVPTAANTNGRFVSVESGDSHNCALTTVGELYCWGLNSDGQLGDGYTFDTPFPVLIATGPFASVAVGSQHSCARSPTGAVSCWGLNSSGQLGDGTITNRLTPTPVLGGLSFASITAGADHTCGVTTEGIGYCWGETSSGQTGVELPLPVPRPVVTSVTFRRP
jgi:alpha-tubulin suppressor-like RCC1 family protein